jgi:hypothetical protein
MTTEDTLLERALANPDMAPFAMFNVTLPGGGDLWSITSKEVSPTTHAREARRTAVQTHSDRVQAMASRVASGNPAIEGDDMDDAIPLEEAGLTPPDEWVRFWGGASPTEGHYIPRSAFAHNCTTHKYLERGTYIGDEEFPEE